MFLKICFQTVVGVKHLKSISLHANCYLTKCNCKYKYFISEVYCKYFERKYLEKHTCVCTVILDIVLHIHVLFLSTVMASLHPKTLSYRLFTDMYKHAYALASPSPGTTLSHILQCKKESQQRRQQKTLYSSLRTYQ